MEASHYRKFLVDELQSILRSTQWLCNKSKMQHVDQNAGQCRNMLNFI